MVEELICLGLQCVLQGGGKVVEAILQLASGVNFPPIADNENHSKTQD